MIASGRVLLKSGQLEPTVDPLLAAGRPVPRSPVASVRVEQATPMQALLSQSVLSAKLCFIPAMEPWMNDRAHPVITVGYLQYRQLPQSSFLRQPAQSPQKTLFLIPFPPFPLRAPPREAEGGELAGEETS